MEKSYNAKEFEEEIYEKWETSGTFQPNIESTKSPFTISLPPPNATGTLHLGHAVMLALQDIMIRWKRMNGHPTLWLPGTDHAAIATQNMVEKKLQNEGIAHPRAELGREKLIDEIKKFVAKSQDTIRNQMKKMGASCDWSRERYTLDDELNHAVNTFFGGMYKDDLIYQGDRIVNWDPKLQTTLADDELEYKEEKTKFYYFQYGPVIIGTARPETKFADKVIVVHPDDIRYKHLHGQEFEVEWINGPIRAKVIADPCIDPSLGTGAMTITPAHSMIDFELAEKYNLEKPQIIDYKGHLTDIAGEFAGMDIQEARPKIVEKLKNKGLLVKIDENYVHNIAVNYRGKGVVEPQIMKQWFVDVNKQAIEWKNKKQSIKQVLQDTVRSGMIRIIPDRFEKIYFNWVDNLRDWCISRQLWWGHQIPMWYRVSPEDKARWEAHPNSSSFLLEVLGIQILEKRFSEEKPEGGEWIRDPDSLDTWFSSALWTFSTLGWPEHTEDFKKFHPTNVLETGYDIIFFWVARMIIASTYCLRSDGLTEEQSIPFKEVYLHGLIRDINGQKMSKSRPETCIDPLDMIEKYGTDAVRLSLIVGNTPGNDMRLYEDKIAGYRNFVNKIWNASRFALMNINDLPINTDNIADLVKSRADQWILSQLSQLVEEVNTDLEKFRFSDAATKIYEFTWSKYCDWYLEISKTPELLNPPVLIYVLKTILKLLHPFIPFVTEAIWSYLKEPNLLITQNWPEIKPELCFEKESEEMETVIAIISAIRSIRADKKVPPGKKIQATIYAGIWTKLLEDKREPIMRLARLSQLILETEGSKPENSLWHMVNGIDIYLPMADLFDIEEEKKRLQKKIEETLTKMKAFEDRLKNEVFLSKAPAEVVQRDQKIFADLEGELKGLQTKIAEIEQ